MTKNISYPVTQWLALTKDGALHKLNEGNGSYVRAAVEAQARFGISAKVVRFPAWWLNKVGITVNIDK